MGGAGPVTVNGERGGMRAAWRMAAPRFAAALVAAVAGVLAVRSGSLAVAVIAAAAGAWAVVGAVFALWLGWLCGQLEAEE